jgi:predicted metal-dependent HD superfamily phosphohydrolase
VYRTYVAQIRQECQDLPLDQILAARVEVLTKFLDKDTLFATSAAIQWEAPARHNVEAELALTLKELDALRAEA